MLTISIGFIIIFFSIFTFHRPVRGVWEVLKAQTETSGLNHLKSSNQFFAELSKMTEIAETCREKRRIREEAVRLVSHLSHFIQINKTRLYR